MMREHRSSFRIVKPDARGADTPESGFTLLELVVTLVVLSILTVGVAPLVRTAVKRQREQQLREALREVRAAIDEFHRDSTDSEKINAQLPPNAPPPAITLLARSRVVITDAKIFTTDNPDRYPPTLETLVEGVNVIPRVGQGSGGRGEQGVGISELKTPELATKKKVYLRKIPIDPMTGEADWELRSSYDEADSTSWGGENVFDVRSKSEETALNGEKYSDW